MDTLTRLLVISILGCVEGEGARAGEPVVFAAVPLHAPVPVVHVLSPAPLRALARPRLRPRTPTADLEVEASANARYRRPLPAASRDADYEENYESPRVARPPTAAHSYEDVEFESYPSRPVPARAYSTSHLYSPAFAQPAPAPALSYDHDEVYAGGSAELLYARPLPSGGYAYRRVAPKATAPPPPPPPRPAKEPPYIIKIHKYRIVKDRRRRR